MNIEIKADGFDPGTALLEFARYCAAFELGALKNQIAAVGIHLSAADKPQDGEDKTCLVQVDLHGDRKVTVQTLGYDFHFAIFQALERAGWKIAQGLYQTQSDVSHPRIIERTPAGHHEPERAA
jgi:hypothetical protein